MIVLNGISRIFGLDARQDAILAVVVKDGEGNHDLSVEQT